MALGDGGIEARCVMMADDDRKLESVEFNLYTDNGCTTAADPATISMERDVCVPHPYFEGKYTILKFHPHEATWIIYVVVLVLVLGFILYCVLKLYFKK